MPKRYFLTLCLIATIAILFRFWQFSSIPPGLYQDEAMNGADAISSLESGKFNVFYPNNNGREGMIIWLDALAIKLFGTEPWVLRLFPAIAGVLAVLGLYFLAKELFNPEIALASSFFMAVSFWAVNFSRIGFRANLMLPFLIWSFYFLLRSFNKNPVSDTGFRIGGILFGLGFYTYISYRFAPVLAFVTFGLLLFKNKSPAYAKASADKKKLWLGIIIFSILALIVALPIGVYFIRHQPDFFGRASEVSIWTQESPILAGIINIGKTLAMFNIAGDFNWRHNYAGSPEFFLPIGILFLLGIWLSFKRFSFSEKFLLAWFFVFLFPNFLTAESNPHSLRALGAMPATMIFAGIGLIWLYQKIKEYLNKKIGNSKFEVYKCQLIRIKKEIFLLFIIFLFFTASFEFSKYFYKWAHNPNVFGAFSKNQVELANYINNLPEKTIKYVIWNINDRKTDNGLPVSAQTVYFLTAKKTNVNYLRSNEIDKIKPGNSETIIAPIYFDLDLLHNLNRKFSKSRIEIIGLNAGIVIVP